MPRPKCATIGCKNTATHELTYTNPGYRDEPVVEPVCQGCGEGYVRRPTLKATLLFIPTRQQLLDAGDSLLTRPGGC